MPPLQSIPSLGTIQIAMQQDMSRMNRVSTNLANALTPGYKREVGTASGSDNRSAPFVTAMQRVVHDMQPGTVKPTGHALDLALSGPGFFEVMTSQGPAYTRQGQFQIDAQGRLVTMRGEPVMGTGGEITLGGGAVQIDAKGVVTEDDHTVGQLKLVEFEDTQALAAQPDSLFSAPDQTHEHEATGTTLRQGYLENSNVQPMHEMVQMMQTMRHFESMQRAAQGMDDMLGVAIRKLGDL
jgi:flagellar basal-body rod protein FlgG